MRILALLVVAAGGVLGCVRHVDLTPVDAAIDSAIGPDADVDAAGPDAAGPDASFAGPDAAPDATVDAF